MTRERRRAKRNPHLASVQVNGRALLSMLRSLAGEGFRLERMVPFGAHALASHGAPWLLLRTLAGEGVRLSSKRNGAAAFVGA